MQGYFAALTIVLLLGMVLIRALLMRRKGIKAIHFGEIDKKDFLIPPFALFYFYIVFAAAFDFPTVSRQEFFHSGALSWVGVLLCLVGLFLIFLSLVSFGKSFRVGIDQDHPDKLVTTGIFAFSRNPIYVALGLSCWANSWCFRTGFFWSTWSPPYGCSTVRYCAKKNT
jgi:protein-S-isoprenylcysteine O-methyltransferase Ste14